MSAQRVLLVGSGLTSATLASKLAPYTARGVELVVWDRARGTGGRLVTQYSSNKDCRVDPGAQYITNTRAFSSIHEDFYKDLVQAGLLIPVTEGHKDEELEQDNDVEEVITQVIEKGDQGDIATMLEKRLNKINGENDKLKAESNVGSSDEELVSVSLDDKCWSVVTKTDFSKMAVLTKPINYVAPLGVNNMIKHLWNQVEIPINLRHNVSEINLSGDQWLVKKEGSSIEEPFSSVILTMPIPQVLNLGGNFRDVISGDIHDNLRAVKFNSVFTLALFYDRPMYGFTQMAKYFPKDPVVRFVAVDNLKRRDRDAPTSILIQTHRKFASANFGLSKEEMEPILYKHVMELMPELPTPNSVRCHRWRYSQVETPYPGAGGSVVLHDSPLLMAAGDSFTHSNVDGCLTSAHHAAGVFLDKLGIQDVSSSVNIGT